MIEVREWDGKPITEPGVYRGIPMQDSVGPDGQRRPGYHSADICDGPSLSSSILRAAESTSMDEVWLRFPGNPDCEPRKDTESFIRGRARHTLFLGEGGFLRDYCFKPEQYPKGVQYPTPRSPEMAKFTMAAEWCKAWAKDMADQKKAILPADEMTDIKGAAEKLANHPEIKDGGILNGLIEHSIFWRDPVTGIWLKARPDNLITDSAMVTDYKGTGDVSYRAIEKALDEYGYAQQLALIGEGVKAVSGIEITDYVLVFQKWTKPWSVNVKPVTGEAIEFGARLNRRAINKIAKALETGVWPGPDDDGVPVGLPKYASDRLKKQIESGLLPEPTGS